MITITTTVITNMALLLLLLLLLLVLLPLLLLLLRRAFPRFLPEEPVGGYTHVHKGWQAWTFVDFGQALAKAVALGGGWRCNGLRWRGVWRNSGGRFLPVEAAGGHKPVAGAYFRGRGACTQYDPKVILGAKTLDPKGDAYYGS